MAKKNKDLTIELLAEEATPPSALDEIRGDTRLDSFLSLSKERLENGAPPPTSPTLSELSAPSSSNGEGWGEGNPTGNINRVLVGRLIELDNAGTPYVVFQGIPSSDPLPARSTIKIGQYLPNQEVVLMFENDDSKKPIILGLIQNPKEGLSNSSSHNPVGPLHPVDVDLDRERLTFTAKKEIVLKCGKASITLTKAGKVLIRGAYLLSRSSGVNRVKGGSVQIN